MKISVKGIKKGYPRLPFPEKLKAWTQLLRPFTLVAPAIAVLFGVTAQLGCYGQLELLFERWATVIYCMLCLMMAQAVGQILNQTEDPVELDIMNKKSYRPLPSGRINRDEAMSLAWILAVFTLARSFTVNLWFGAFISTLLLFAITYNMEPIRIKKRVWLNTGWLAISRGVLPFPAVWSIFGSPLDLEPWLIGSVIGVWVLAWQNTKDLNDIPGDLKFGVVTPALYHGVRKLGIIMLPISLLSFILLGIYIWIGWLPMMLGTLFLLGVPTLWMHFKYLTKDIRELTTLENNDLWAGFYLGLAGWYILAALAFSL